MTQPSPTTPETPSGTPPGTPPGTSPGTVASAGDAEARLAPLRRRIDALDQRIVELLNERAEVVVEIGHVKRDGDAAIYAPDREKRVLDQVRAYNKGPLPDACLEGIWRELMSGSFALERPLRIGYLGPPGSFTHLAAKRKFGSCVAYEDLDTISAVFDEIARGHLDQGLVPIENSAIGGIGESLDCFLSTNVQVCAEVLLNVHMELLSHASLNGITRVYSKPEALAQCRGWLSGNLPGAERIGVASTSKAVELAAVEHDAAAVGSSLAGELNGVPVRVSHIEDNPHNTTRFFVLGPRAAKPTGDDKTSVMFTTANKPGALTAVLDVFRDHGLNMTQLTSRPSRRESWEYVFFVDLAGHASDQKLQAALHEARAHCNHELTVLGSYPRATGPI